MTLKQTRKLKNELNALTYELASSFNEMVKFQRRNFTIDFLLENKSLSIKEIKDLSEEKISNSIIISSIYSKLIHNLRVKELKENELHS